MPVMLGVDINRFLGIGVQGEPIYQQNGVPVAPSAGDGRSDIGGSQSHHSVVVVGCSWRRDARDGNVNVSDITFLFHDPATMPLLEASVGDLAQVGVSPSLD